ncbi:glycoside hydrolase family 27 protein [Streptomyces lichenis]|uniref:Alpha-galactosidase n=1 Tax=Streptomyces lichenis TaxID=2306967 RepID=A0ABT0I6N4_9ACTN|nr:ricin-type beta-trefoil lectin domain protein [Streptomyces lichenis]MCK8676979.1 ricin-type beta-trefoil lectin domain protein [Streptomyces lichenis]
MSVRSTLTAVFTAGVTAAALVTALPATPAAAHDNGVALTPPMGWNSWNRFGCGITEAKVRAQADAIATKGLKAAGYQYVVVDDCWMASQRDGNGNLTHDTGRFPGGMKALADYVHGKGLKFGLYQSPTQGTCQKRPGSYGYERKDAQQFAAWGVDYLKYDWCQTSPQESPRMWADFPGKSEKDIAKTLFTRMSNELKATDRPIVYSLSACCSAVDFPSWAGSVSNLWRTSTDIGDTWNQMLRNAGSAIPYSGAAKRGAWNDPDMLEVGNGGMTDTEYRTHFSVWAQLAAPLIAGNDLSTTDSATLGILRDTDVIAVDQDSLGSQATAVTNTADVLVLSKPLANGDRSISLTNKGSTTATISTTATAAGLPSASSYKLANLWSKAVTSTSGTISATLPAHGTAMFRVAPGTGSTVGATRPLVSASSLRCLDVADHSTTPGAKVAIWDCNGGGNQTTTFTAAGELRLNNGTQCLDVPGGSTGPGTKVVLWTCNGGENQKWQFAADGTVVGKQSGLCLDVTGGDKPAGNVNGTELEIWSCNPGANQKWHLG